VVAELVIVQGQNRSVCPPSTSSWWVASAVSTVKAPSRARVPGRIRSSWNSPVLVEPGCTSVQIATSTPLLAGGPVCREQRGAG
jgi:hypothetical protein